MSTSPYLIDSPVSDDASAAVYNILTLPRVTTKPPITTLDHSAHGYSSAPWSSPAEEQPIGVPSLYSPASCGSNSSGSHHMTFLFAASPSSGFMSSMTPSPIEAATVLSRFPPPASDYFHHHPKGGLLSSDDDCSAALWTSSAYSKAPLTQTDDRRRSEPLFAPMSPFLSGGAGHVTGTRLPGVMSAHPDLEEGVNPFTTSSPTDGSWVLPVALKADTGIDDRAKALTYPGLHSEGAAQSEGHVRDSLSSGFSRGDGGLASLHAPARVPSYDTIQDMHRSHVALAPASATEALRRASVPTPYPYAQLASSSYASSSSGGQGSDESRIYSFVPLPGSPIKKRPRRRYDEIERLYKCSFTLPTGEECTKSYGTLNHLNAHIQMQRHGEKRTPAEFKELRKQWRKAKKDADVYGHSVNTSTARSYAVPSAPSEHYRGARPTLGLQIPGGYTASTSSLPTSANPGPYTPLTPTHPYNMTTEAASNVYPQDVSTLSPTYLSTPTNVMPSGVYATPHPEHAQGTSGAAASSGWASLYPSYLPERSSQPTRMRIPSGYAQEGIEHPAGSSTSTFTPPIGTTYTPAQQYSDAYSLYTPAPTSRQVNTSSIYEHSMYYPASGSHADVQKSSTPTQDDIDAFAAHSSLLTPLPGYQHHSLDQSQHDVSAPESSTYAPAVPRSGTDLTTPGLSAGAWRSLEQHATDIPTHHVSHRH